MRAASILPSDVTAAIAAQLAKTFPGETVYTDLTPRDFERPSSMVELAGLSLDPLAYGPGGVELLLKYKITTFSVVDEVHASHLPVLDLRAMLVLKSFGSGFIRVKDRAPKVRSLEADTSLFDCAVVTLTLALTLDRAEFAEQELYELMQHFRIKIQAKE